MDIYGVWWIYCYNGEEVDRQIYFGFDLVLVCCVFVDFVNFGIVVLVEYFGIYGNVVVVDYGYGLMMLYVYFLLIVVEEGEIVQCGVFFGCSGEIGLVGGDYFYFGVLLQGVFVFLVEWFDVKWICDCIV